MWTGIPRVEMTTSLHDYDDQDRLFRVRFPAAVDGGRSVSEVGNAVIGRPFGRPNVDVAEVPFTLDHPAYDWFALGATARVTLGDASATGARASRAIGVAEVVVPDDPGQDAAVRDLVVALVRQGVTSTVSRHDGHRYGVLHIDSNLPDVRVAIGGPDENRFVASVLDAADPGYRAELDRQLAAQGWARLWVPEDGEAGVRADPITDLRGSRDLPVLDRRRCRRRRDAGRDRRAGARSRRRHHRGRAAGRARWRHGPRRGLHRRDAEPRHPQLQRRVRRFSLYLSIMRSCSGWPSGVWIDPPRRSTPDGANFQFQHWSHHFEYADRGRRRRLA